MKNNSYDFFKRLSCGCLVKTRSSAFTFTVSRLFCFKQANFFFIYLIAAILFSRLGDGGALYAQPCIDGAPQLSFSVSDNCFEGKPCTVMQYSVTSLAEYSNDGYALSFPGFPSSDQQFVFGPTGGSIEQHIDGDIHITGVIFSPNNPDNSWNIDIWLDNRLSWPDWVAANPGYSDPQLYQDPSGLAAGGAYADWNYMVIHPDFPSTFTGMGNYAGTTLTLSQNFGMAGNHYGFQLGFSGANGFNGLFGLSGLFSYTATGNNIPSYLTTEGSGALSLNTFCPPKTCSGAASVLVSGGQPPYQYAWSNGMNSSSVNGLCANDYTLTVTDASGCVVVQTITVSETPVPQPDLGNNASVACGSTPTLLALNEQYVAYHWSNGENTPTIAVSASGTYSVTVTSENGCTASDAVSLTFTAAANPVIEQTTGECGNVTLSAIGNFQSYQWSNGQTTPQITVNSNNSYSVTVTTAEGCTGSAVSFVEVSQNISLNLGDDFTACEPMPLYAGFGYASYLWNTGETSPSITATQSGTYSVIVTDGNGCSASDAIGVTLLQTSALNAFIISSTCDGAVIGATAGFDYYSWSTGATSPNIWVTNSGTYTVSATTLSGCVVTASVNVVLGEALSVDLGPNQIACGSTTLSAPAGMSYYIWSNGQMTQSITVNSSGNYSVTVSDANGCTASDDTFVTVDTNGAAVNIGNDFASCGSTVLDAGPLYAEFLWNTGATGQAITINETGTYSVTVTTATGCTASADVVVTITGTPPTVDIALEGNACNNAQLTATAGFDHYHWSNGATSASITVNSSGNYSLTVTDTNGCTASDNISVNLNSAPSLNLGANISTCSSQTTITAPGAYGSYLWSNGATSASITVNSSGNYSLTVTDTNGCTASDNISVNVNSAPSVNLGADIMAETPVTLDAGSGFSSYQWSTGATSQTITVSSSGTYSVTVTNGAGCTAADAVVVTIQTTPPVCPEIGTPSASATLICSGDAISLSLPISGGDGGTVTWYFGSGTQVSNPNNVVLNAYECNGKHYNFHAEYNPATPGCPTMTSSIVSVNVLPQISGTLSVNDCMVTLSGICPDYIASWADDLGNNGTGNTYEADSGTSGTVTFTVQNPLAEALDCGTQTLSASFVCDNEPLTGSISGFVWADNNGNGLQDSGEGGLQGVAVLLFNATTNQQIGGTFSDVNGDYTFAGLLPGTYYVVFETPDNYTTSPQNIGSNDNIDSDYTTDTGQSPTTSINGNTVSYDAGFVPPPCNPNAGSLTAVDASLCNDNAGNSTLLLNGTPTVPSGYDYAYFIADDAGNIVGDISDNNEFSLMGMPAGTYCAYGIAYLVSNPYNASANNITELSEGDGCFDISNCVPFSVESCGTSNTPPTAVNDVVTLCGPVVQTIDIIDNDIAGSSSSLQINTLTGSGAGTLTLSADSTSVSYMLDNNSEGTDVFTYTIIDGNGLVSNEGTITIIRDCPAEAGSISGFVWADLNENGQQDAGEAGIANSPVLIFNATTNQQIGGTFTNSEGFYAFSGLLPGDYYVLFETLNGYTPTAQDAGGNNDIDSDFNPANGHSDVLSINGNNEDIDAGFVPPPFGNITGLVWNDLNANGIQDAGEPGLPSVVVVLFAASSDMPVDTTLTDGNGNYIFTDLFGDYYVQFPTPAGFDTTPQGQGSDNTLDSDYNPADGQTSSIGISGVTVEFDAGFVALPPQEGSISGYVWADLNSNGIQDSGELPVEDAAVLLFNASTGQQINGAFTTSDGQYAFNGLLPGDYYLVFETPSNYGTTLQGQGSDDTLDSDYDPANGQTITVGINGNSVVFDAGFVPQVEVIAQNDCAVTAVNVPVTFSVLDNDMPATGLTVVAVTNLDGTDAAEITINTNGTLTYMPSAGFSGIDTFTYTVSYADGATASAQIFIQVGVVNTPPVAQFLNACTSPITPVNICLPIEDPDGDNAFIASAFTTFAANVLVLNDSCIRVTPMPGFLGIDTVFVSICDAPTDVCGNPGITQCSVTQIILTVPCINAIDDYAATLANTPSAPICVTDNDTYYELTGIIIVSPPSFGNVAIEGNCIIYTPSPDNPGSDSFEYMITDSNGNTDIATVYVTVGDPTSGPIAVDDYVNLEIGATAAVVYVIGNDLEPDSLTLTVIAVGPPTCGTTGILDDGTVIYIACPDFTGIDSFWYVIENPLGLQDTGYVYIMGNTPPPTGVVIAEDNNNNTIVNTPITIDVLQNDLYCTDMCAVINDILPTDDVTITIIDPANNGTTTVQTADGDDVGVLYTPNTDFVGIDSFSYQVCVNTICDTAVVTVEIFSDPFVSADNDSYTLTSSDPLLLPVSTNDSLCAVSVDTTCILLSDLGPNFTTTIDTILGADLGTAVINGTSIEYTPFDGAAGIDTLQYVICVANPLFTACDTAEVIVYINVCSSLADAQPDVAFVTMPNAVTIEVLDNDSGTAIGVLNVITTPFYGTAVLNAADNTITYTPTTAGITDTSDFFFYTIIDSCGNIDTALVGINILMNDTLNLPPTAGNDVASTTGTTPVTIPVLGNDTDPNGDTLTVVSVIPPASGTVTINPDGTITFTPDTLSPDTVCFQYVVCDTSLCDTAWVCVTVGDTLPPAPSNQPPIAEDDDATVESGQSVTIPILNNDYDPDGDTIDTVTIITPPAHGTAEIDDNGVVTYTPDPGYEGPDYIEYIICDDGLPVLCDTGVVIINVTPPPTNNPPVAADNYATTLINTPVTIGVLGNDFDPDGDPIVLVSITEPPMHGTAVIVGDSITYTPNTDWIGCDTFTYVIQDQVGGGTDTAIVVVCTDSTLIPPVAVDDFATTEFEPIMIPVLENDLGNDIIIKDITCGPNFGTVGIEINPDGSMELAYIPDTCGVTDTICYVIEDANGLTDTALVIIEVLCPDTTGGNVIAVNDSLPCSTPITVGEPICIDVLANDSDANGDTLSVAIILTAPLHGTAQIDTSLCAGVIYTPDTTFTGNDTLVYIVSNTQGETDTASVFICGTLLPNDQPYLDAQDDIETITADGDPFDVPVAGNDDICVPNGDGTFTCAPVDSILSITIIEDPLCTIGNIDIANGTVQYIPCVEAAGTDDSFTYVICAFTNGVQVCDTAVVTITVQPIECEPFETFFIPNGFTPNGDNINDLYLIPQIEQCVPDNEVLIFNRWGDRVYRQVNYNDTNAWNGEYENSNQPVPDGTYFMILIDNETGKKRNGCIELKR